MKPRLDKRALFALVGYEPHDGQVLVHRSKAKRRVLACGVRWGKSTAASMEALAALLEPRADTMGWTVAPTYELSRRVFLRVVNLAERYFQHHIESFDLRQHQLVMRNLSGGRSELRGKSTDNPDSLLGEGLDFVIVDEAARVDDEAWESCLSQRLIDRDGWALVVSTPAGKHGWFYRAHRRGLGGRDPMYESWSSPSAANPNLSAALIEAERQRLPPETFAEQFEARFMGAETDTCERCGGPVRSGPRIVLSYEAEPSRCTECHDLVDDKGHSVAPCGKDGMRQRMMILKLHAASGVALDEGSANSPC